MDEDTLFKFGNWVAYGRVHRRDEKFPRNGAWSGSRDPFKNVDSFNIFRTDEGAL